jgi:5'-3' exonuclease
MYNFRFDYQIVYLDVLRKHLVRDMKWGDNNYFSNMNAINDFIMICFFVGNDFIPMSPSFDITEGGMDIILDEYKNVCSGIGHLTMVKKDTVEFNLPNFKEYIKVISKYEKMLLEQKLNSDGKYYFDKLLFDHSSIDEDGRFKILNFDFYRKSYYRNKLNLQSSEQICRDYMYGVSWVLAYYSRGMPDWDWNYPFHYAPFACDLLTVLDSLETPKFYTGTRPQPIYVQLMSILPPQSADVLPEPFAELLKNKDSPLAEFCPYSFEVDMDNKLKDWEGNVIIPFVNKEIVFKYYFENLERLTKEEIRRNKPHFNIIYQMLNGQVIRN